MRLSLIGTKTFIKREFILTSKEIDWNGRGPELYIVSAHILRITSSIKHHAKLDPYEYIIQCLPHCTDNTSFGVPFRRQAVVSPSGVGGRVSLTQTSVTDMNVKFRSCFPALATTCLPHCTDNTSFGVPFRRQAVVSPL